MSEEEYELLDYLMHRLREEACGNLSGHIMFTDIDSPEIRIHVVDGVQPVSVGAGLTVKEAMDNQLPKKEFWMKARNRITPYPKDLD